MEQQYTHQLYSLPLPDKWVEKFPKQTKTLKHAMCFAIKREVKIVFQKYYI